MKIINRYLQIVILIVAVTSFIIFVTGCGGGMNAISYHAQGQQQLAQYNCSCDTSFKKAADMEFEKKGNMYPIYMMDLALERIYCNNPDQAIKAFYTVDQYVVKKSERSIVTKGVEFIKSKNKQLYDLTDREETLLHYYIGLAHYQTGNYDDALVELKKVDYIAEGTYSKLPLSNLMRGLIYLKLGEKDNALVAFKKMMDTNSKSTLGYKLAILYETDQSNRDFYKRTMLEKTGFKYIDPPQGKKPTLVIVDIGWKIDIEKESIRFDISNQESDAAFVDVVDPDFDFSKLIGGFFSDAASYVGRALAKNAISKSIPFLGGIVGDALLGSEGGDARKWSLLPTLYYGDLLYIDEDTHELSIKYYKDNKIEAESKTVIKRSKNDVYEIKF